jgi:hypothetical protein
MAASTALNTILRDARKGALLRMTAEVARAPFAQAIGRYLQTKVKGFSRTALVSFSEYP